MDVHILNLFLRIFLSFCWENFLSTQIPFWNSIFQKAIFSSYKCFLDFS